MIEYHKIQTAWLRNPATNYKTLLEGQWAKPEFGYLKDAQWIATEKIDGTNIRVMWDGAAVTFNGKTDNAQMPGPLVAHLNATFTAEKMAAQFGAEGGVCLYGEGYGGSIQKGSYYRMDQAFVLFDAHIGKVWLERENVQDIANGLGVPAVPVAMIGMLTDIVECVRNGSVNEASMGVLMAPAGRREGLVMRPTVELTNRYGERVITKIKVKDFVT